MEKKIQNCLVIGIVRNWETALAQPVPVWGLKPLYQSVFQALNIGDMLWFYATSPVKGVIGLGMIKDKYVDKMNLIWDEELKKKEVIWPLRFRIQVLKVINRGYWKSDCINIKDFGLNWQVGFQLLSDEHAIQLADRSKSVFGTLDTENLFAGATITQPTAAREPTAVYQTKLPVAESALTHRNLQESIAEMGKLQTYYTQIEYPIELPGEEKNIDVVWKREIAGVPTFAFEIELSGGIERAIARLKFAYTRWNSRPRIVIPEQFSKKVNNIIATEDRNFAEEFKLYEPKQVVQLLNKKRDLKNFEQNLGIY